MILKIKTKSPTLKKKKKKPPCNAEDSSLIPGQGTKISCAVGQLSPVLESPCSPRRDPEGQCRPHMRQRRLDPATEINKSIFI